MNNPLVLRTDAIFGQGLAACDSDCGTVLTPEAPAYWWGNYLWLWQPPADDEVGFWRDQFDRKVRQTVPGVAHELLAWSGLGPTPGALRAFHAEGFKAGASAVLRARRLHAPADIEAKGSAVATIGSANDARSWRQLREFLMRERDADHDETTFAAFIDGRLGVWRRLVEEGVGVWAVARVNNEIVASLGCFLELPSSVGRERLARFQFVGTDKRWRRQGLCTACLLHAQRELLKSHAVDGFVIVADPSGEAIRLYQDLGFRTREYLHYLELARPAIIA